MNKKASRGRPKRTENLHKVYLKSSTYQLWNAKKEEFGFQTSTQDNFAQFLLNTLSPEDETNSGENVSEEPSTIFSTTTLITPKLGPATLNFAKPGTKGHKKGRSLPMMCSTPSVPKKRRQHINVDEQELSLSDDDSDVDVTGISEDLADHSSVFPLPMDSHCTKEQHSLNTYMERCTSANANFSLFDGDTTGSTTESESGYSNNDSDSDSESGDSDSSGPASTGSSTSGESQCR